MITHELVSTRLDRVRAHTAPHINHRIDRQIEENVKFFGSASEEEISQRLLQLEREWDIERVLEVNAASIALIGSVLTALVNRRFVVVPLFVSSFLLQHGVQGWCPPVPIFRRLGVRTRSEIDVEKFALKAMRGDFEHVQSKDAVTVLNAVAEDKAA